MSRLRVVRALSDSELSRAAAFRRGVFLERRRVAFDEALESRRDRAGHVLLLLRDSIPVATARALPHPCDLSPVASMCRDLGVDADSEVGRIAAVPSPGASSYALAMLTLGSIWFLRHTRRKRYVAYCHPRLVDFYRLVGAADIGRECVVPGRSEVYRLVSGSFEDAARLGAELMGIDDQAATPSELPRRIA
jgi:hypothetical protein